MSLSQRFAPLERPPSISRSIQDAIREYVLIHRLQAGDPLPPETELARQLGVGRNSVREAVKALESLGILEVRRGTGLFVRDFSIEPLLDNLPYAIMSDLQDLAEVFEVRRLLEVGAIEKAMARMAEPDLEQLQQTVEQMRVRAERGEAFVHEDRQFHQQLFGHVGNKVLLLLLDSFWLLYRKAVQNADIAGLAKKTQQRSGGARPPLLDRDGDPMRTYREHAAIVDAIRAGDVNAAREALDRHYDGLLHRLRKIEDER